MSADPSSTIDIGCVLPSYHFDGSDESRYLCWPDHSLLLHLPRSIAEAVQRCGSFGTLQEQLRIGKGDHREHLLLVTRQLAEFGALVTKSGLIKQLVSPKAKPTRVDGSVTTLALITKNRTSSALSCLRGFMDVHTRENRAVEYAVFDDTTDPEVRLEFRDRLALLGRELKVPIFYAGADERRDYALALARHSGVSKELLEFALINPFTQAHSPGVSRNAALLHCVGELFVMTDDDIFCKATSPRIMEEGIHLSALGTRRQIEFFKSRSEMLEKTIFRELDPLTLHDEFLGRSVGSCIAGREGDEVLLSDLTSEAVQRLMRGHPRVAVTATGFVGESGIRPFTFYLKQTGDDRSRLLRSAAFYKQATRNRQMLSATTMPSISHMALMAGFSGYDHRQTLPPFAPFGPDAESIFCRALATCFCDSWICNVPAAVLHDPPPKLFTRGTIRQSYDMLWPDLLNIIMSMYQPQTLTSKLESNDVRLQRLGQHIRHIGSLPTKDFQEFTAIRIWAECSARVANLSKLLKDYDNFPGYWAEDVQRAIKWLESTIGDRAESIPTDIRAAVGINGSSELAGTLVCRFGELLIHWPHIARSSASLKAAGTRLARRL